RAGLAGGLRVSHAHRTTHGCRIMGGDAPYDPDARHQPADRARSTETFSGVADLGTWHCRIWWDVCGLYLYFVDHDRTGRVGWVLDVAGADGLRDRFGCRYLVWWALIGSKP